MGDREDDRQRKLARDALAGFVDEEIEAAHYGLRHLAWEDSWRKGPRWVKRTFLASDHPADNTGMFNLLVVTPTRVMVFAGRPKAPYMKVKRQIAEWPRGAVRVAAKGVRATGHYNQGTSSITNRIVRATFSWDGEERPLILDFPKGPLTHEVLEAARRPAPRPA